MEESKIAITHQDDGKLDVVIVEFLHQLEEVPPVDGIAREVPLAIHVINVECLNILGTHTGTHMVS